MRGDGIAARAEARAMLHRTDDPGLTATRLAAGGAVAMPARRRNPRPDWRMRICIRCLCIAILVATVARMFWG